MLKTLVAASALLAACVSVAAAQNGGGRMAEMISAADTNHDGAVSRAEWDAARGARFDTLDANHDGKLDQSERPHWGPPPGAGGGAPVAGGGHAGPMNADANNDGFISRDEFIAQGGHMFDRLDANHDGQISQDEVQAMQTMMQH